MSEVMKRIFVNEWDKADHEWDGSIATHHVRISTVLKEHVQQFVSKLPVTDMAQNAGEGRVSGLIDTRPSSLCRKENSITAMV